MHVRFSKETVRDHKVTLQKRVAKSTPALAMAAQKIKHTRTPDSKRVARAVKMRACNREQTKKRAARYLDCVQFSSEIASLALTLPYARGLRPRQRKACPRGWARKLQQKWRLKVRACL
jgi:hypothetical protein